MIKHVLSTHEIANLCNVHHTSVINWVNDGALRAYSTPGGHRRINKEDLVRFLKKYKMPIPKEIIKEKKTILIVDDDPEALEELKEALGGNMYQIELAVDAFEAGRIIYKKKPDLILLDFKMPGMDGFQVCSVLQADRETARIPIFAITVLTTKDDEKKILNEPNVKDYFPKPIDLGRLIKKIKHTLK